LCEEAKCGKKQEDAGAIFEVSGHDGPNGRKGPNVAPVVQTWSKCGSRVGDSGSWGCTVSRQRNRRGF